MGTAAVKPSPSKANVICRDVEVMRTVPWSAPEAASCVIGTERPSTETPVILTSAQPPRGIARQSSPHAMIDDARMPIISLHERAFREGVDQ